MSQILVHRYYFRINDEEEQDRRYKERVCGPKKLGYSKHRLTHTFKTEINIEYLN